MPSPRSSLRAPLIWLLTPAMAGIAAAHRWPASPRELVACAGITAVLAAGSVAASRHEFRFAAGVALAGILGAGAGIGFCFQNLRLPRRVDGPMVPREATLDVRVERIFAGGPARPSIGGIGTIRRDDRRGRFAGARVYFSVSRRHGSPPVPSGVFAMRGVLQSPDSNGDAAGFDRMLAEQGITLKLSRAVIVRTVSPPAGLTMVFARITSACEGYLRVGTERHSRESSLETAMFLGEHAQMTGDERTAFQRSGTFHVFVVAGLHVSTVALMLHALLSLLRIPRSPALLAELLLVAGYVAATGAGLPARRTFIMLAFLEAAKVLRQPGNSFAAIVLAATTTLAIDPQELFEAGFQLSYAVVTALIVMATPLARRWENAWRPWDSLPPADRGWLRRAVRNGIRGIAHSAAVSTVALIASAPCMIGNFGLLSLGSVLANLAAVPLASLVVSAGFWSSTCGVAGWPAGCALFNRAAIVLIKGMVVLVAFGSHLPLASLAAGFRQAWMAPVATAAIVGAMLAGAHLRWRRSAGGFWLPVAVFVLVLLFGVKFGANAAMVAR